MHAILEAVFPSRIEAVRALLSPPGPDIATALAEVAISARSVLKLVHEEHNQSDWQNLAEALDIAAKLRSWHQAVRDGETDADRHLRAARLQCAEWKTAETGYGHELKSRLAPIECDLAPNEVSSLLGELARLPFPVSVFTNEPLNIPNWQPETPGQKAELAVAFLEFRINGEQAAALHRLPAGQLHDLELRLRVSRWPDEAERLILKPVSVEPEDVWDLPAFEFPRPEGDAPFMFDAHGRLSIRMRTALGARPLEFLYSAEFQPVSAEQPVAVAGQRSLRLDSSEGHDHRMTGYESLDRRIVELRNRLWAEPRISEEEIDKALHVLKPLANLVGQAVQANVFPDPISEQEFQDRLAEHLRRHPEIGVELEVQAEAGGGRSDLSFRQLRLELKVKNDAQVTKADLERFARQAAAYAVSSDKTIAVLCVLDGSKKSEPPIPMAEAVQIIAVQPGNRPVYVIAFLVQGNLAKPSSLSR